MRASDQANQFNKSHDKQIYDTEHDRIVIELHTRLKTNREFLNEVTRKGVLDETPKIEIESAIMGRRYDNRFVAGFADIKIMAKWKTGETRERKATRYGEEDWIEHLEDWVTSYIEVKTSVNFGDTIRQIKYYCGNGEGHHTDWLVCAPSLSQHEVLLSQGIGYIDSDTWKVYQPEKA